ncbi:hypothetical protein PT2222_100043 [Paraburkholderia tropica]
MSTLPAVWARSAEELSRATATRCDGPPGSAARRRFRNDFTAFPPEDHAARPRRARGGQGGMSARRDRRAPAGAVRSGRSCGASVQEARAACDVVEECTAGFEREQPGFVVAAQGFERVAQTLDHHGRNLHGRFGVPGKTGDAGVLDQFVGGFGDVGGKNEMVVEQFDQPRRRRDVFDIELDGQESGFVHARNPHGTWGRGERRIVSFV